jgi:hypothetical protein
MRGMWCVDWMPRMETLRYKDSPCALLYFYSSLHTASLRLPKHQQRSNMSCCASTIRNNNSVTCLFHQSYSEFYGGLSSAAVPESWSGRLYVCRGPNSLKFKL